MGLRLRPPRRTVPTPRPSPARRRSRAERRRRGAGARGLDRPPPTSRPGPRCTDSPCVPRWSPSTPGPPHDREVRAEAERSGTVRRSRLPGRRTPAGPKAVVTGAVNEVAQGKRAAKGSRLARIRPPRSRRRQSRTEPATGAVGNCALIRRDPASVFGPKARGGTAAAQ